ncbi:MAG: bifunctional DNA-formamidopyrimidine glycosylase/DNA-(apurinic or apyrimidinic site) lyase [Cucumibacter sp.]
MPELPEVETVRRGLEPFVTGALIAHVAVNRGDLRFPFPRNFARRLTGQRIEAIGRRAKYLLFSLSGGQTWLSHLGMTGSWTIEAGAELAVRRHRPAPNGAAHTHLVLTLEQADGTGVTISYADARRFGFMDLFADPADCAFLRHLGPEPLGNEFGAAHLARAFAGKKAPIKAALLDQRIVAGLGNIYVCEALFRANISPRRRASTLVARSGAPRESLERLAEAIRAVLIEAIAAGGSTLRDFRAASGELGYFQHRFEVYDREGEHCLRLACTGIVRRIVQSGRASFYCPVCQR